MTSTSDDGGENAGQSGSGSDSKGPNYLPIALGVIGGVVALVVAVVLVMYFINKKGATSNKSNYEVMDDQTTANVVSNGGSDNMAFSTDIGHSRV